MPLELRSLAEWEAAGIKNLLSIIIPAHNEGGHLALCVKELIKTLDAAGVDHEILIVNDNSTADTGRFDPRNGLALSLHPRLRSDREDTVARRLCDNRSRNATAGLAAPMATANLAPAKLCRLDP